MTKKDRFTIRTYWIECGNEVHCVKLMSDGRLDFSHHWECLGIDKVNRREVEARWALGEIARQGLPGSSNKNSSIGCFWFLQHWRGLDFDNSNYLPSKLNGYEDAIKIRKRFHKHKQEDGRSMQEISSDAYKASKWRMDGLRHRATQFILRKVSKQMSRYLSSSDRYELHIPQLGEELHAATNLSQDNQVLDSYCFNFHDWYKTVYLPLGSQAVVTQNMLMTVKASKVKKNTYALLQTNIYEPFEARFRNQGPRFSREDPSVLYAIIIDKQVIAWGPHPRQMEQRAHNI